MEEVEYEVVWARRENKWAACLIGFEQGGDRTRNYGWQAERVPAELTCICRAVADSREAAVEKLLWRLESDLGTSLGPFTECEGKGLQRVPAVAHVLVARPGAA